MKSFALFIPIGLLLTGCGMPSSSDVSEIDRLRVVSSFFPLTHFAEQIGGEHVSVRQVLPAGAEPHHFEPSPRDMTLLSDADVILLSGADFMEWEERVADLPEVRTSMIVTMADHVPLRAIDDDHEDEEEDHEEDDHGEFDPHFWLDPVIAMRQVEAIRDAFVQTDAQHAEDYRNNTDALLTDLRTLDQEFAQGLQGCALNAVVVSHDSFSYLADRYGFSTIAIAGMHQEEISPRALADIVRLMRETGIEHVFSEKLVSPRVSETIARETEAQVLLLDTIHGLTAEDSEKSYGYVDLMRENLKQLRTALSCS